MTTGRSSPSAHNKSAIFKSQPPPPPDYQPEVRHIPIKRVETRFNADNTTTQTVRVDENPAEA